MPEPQTQGHTKRLKPTFHGLQVVLPVKATFQPQGEVIELGGQLALLGASNARIRLERPIAKGTALSVLVEFADRRGREIRFRFQGKVVSDVNDPWDETAVDFEEGVGLSGEHAREVLAELFP